MTEIEQILGNNIRRLRLYYDWTQTELADLIGVKQASVQRWEAGGWLSAENVTSLAKVFKCDPCSLFARDGAVTIDKERQDRTAKEILKNLKDVLKDI